MGGLISSTHGGPYLENAPFNPAYYRFTIASQAVLMIATVKSLGPPIVYRTPVLTRAHRPAQKLKHSRVVGSYLRQRERAKLTVQQWLQPWRRTKPRIQGSFLP